MPIGTRATNLINGESRVEFGPVPEDIGNWHFEPVFAWELLEEEE